MFRIKEYFLCLKKKEIALKCSHYFNPERIHIVDYFIKIMFVIRVVADFKFGT